MARGDALALELAEAPGEAVLGTLAVLAALGEASEEALAVDCALTVGDEAEDALLAGESVRAAVDEGCREEEGDATAVEVPVLQGEGEPLENCVAVANAEPEGTTEELAEGDESTVSDADDVDRPVALGLFDRVRETDALPVVVADRDNCPDCVASALVDKVAARGDNELWELGEVDALPEARAETEAEAEPCADAEAKALRDVLGEGVTLTLIDSGALADTVAVPLADALAVPLAALEGLEAVETDICAEML